ncbi:MAG TPA: type II CAAX endopeptidase family protein [Blastocatellia bacterium]|nr:type II CAAX endopeptidase family protein [Blastocatellia bacterium]
MEFNTSDGPKVGQQVLELPGEAGGAPLSDDRFARDLRRFGPIGILAIFVILAGNFLGAPLSAILALLWVWRSHTPWREIGYVRPKNWIATVTGGIVFGIAFKFLMKSIVMPLLGADPINQAYHYLAGNRAALPGAIFLMIVVAGFGEETVFRGYLFERFGKLLGPSVWAKTVTVLLTSAWFGILHYSVQGFAGAEQAVITGLVFGTIFAVTGRIWRLMISHAAFDLTALAIIYWDVESKLAHLVFK